MPVVVVESPAKARKIKDYLGKDHIILASFGHVRDLLPKDGSVDPDHDFAMRWEIAKDSSKHVKAIADALRRDDCLILATDPDREGEAISWHLTETLLKRKAIRKSTNVRRVAFNAITRNAVTEAMRHPRNVDMPLVEAYLARRALDYLVGFNISPVLWRKLPGARSAGRVQSVCLRLVVEREIEIESFKSREYWTVTALCETPREGRFKARLVTLGGKKLGRFDIGSAEAAQDAVAQVQKHDLLVHSVEAKTVLRHPAPPFRTSTLQQEASRKLGMGARQTMTSAQRLYEAGHITYMRTDGIDMVPEAVTDTRNEIARRLGDSYVPKALRKYKNKARNAQEAHECIRPTDIGRDARSLGLSEDSQYRLYDLIWKRTLACQMESARLERTTVDLGSADQSVMLRATGQVIKFDGFLKVYEEGRDDSEDEDRQRLPEIRAKEPLATREIKPEQHFTKPPPRYTEATLVAKIEELGIGRPSTYASIVATIQEREYVRKEANRLVPESKGRVVTAFLTNYFRHYVDYGFTADMEKGLDRVSRGEVGYRDLLGDFWRDFLVAVNTAKDLSVKEVLGTLDEALAPQLYPQRDDGSDPRLCPLCGTGQLHMKPSRDGGFVGCSRYPECRFARSFSGETVESDSRVLGYDNGDEISLRHGRFGPYVQRGSQSSGDDPKPQRASLPKDWRPEDLDCAMALKLLSLPREIGEREGVMIEAGIGRYGPYVRHGRLYANLGGIDEVFEIGMNRAAEVLDRKSANGGYGRAVIKPLRELGEHPDGGPVAVFKGRYGPYVKWGKINATIPNGTDPEKIDRDAALRLIAAKAAKGGGKTPRKTPSKATKRKATPKTTARKATSSATTRTATSSATTRTATSKTTARKTAKRTPSSRKASAARGPGSLDTEDDYSVLDTNDPGNRADVKP